MSSYIHWSSEDDRILIGYVHAHEILYNVKLKSYRSSQLKQTLWCEVAAKLNKTDAECHKRWCYVRDYYIRRKGKPTGTGSSGEAAKKRAKLLSFLDGISNSRPRIERVDIQDRSELTQMNTQDRSELTQMNSQERSKMTTINNPDRSEITPMNTQHRSEITLNVQDRSELTQPNTEIRCDPTVFFKLEEEEIACAEDYANYNNENSNNSDNEDLNNGNLKRTNIVHGDESLNTANKKLCCERETDENDLFFSSMAKIVKKLPRYEQAQIRMQIGALVGNAELRCFSVNSSQIDTSMGDE